MQLFNEIEKQIKECMKLKRNPDFADAMVAYENVYKSVKTKALAIAKEQKTEEITDEIVIQAVKKEIKELDQTIAVSPAESQNAKTARLQKEEIEAYVPAKLEGSALEDAVEAILLTLAPESNFGACMKACMKELAGKADGKDVKAVIEKFLK